MEVVLYLLLPFLAQLLTTMQTTDLLQEVAQLILLRVRLMLPGMATL